MVSRQHSKNIAWPEANLRNFDTRPVDLLSFGDIGTRERVQSEADRIISGGLRRLSDGLIFRNIGSCSQEV
jgi:hypothetical protein